MWTSDTTVSQDATPPTDAKTQYTLRAIQAEVGGQITGDPDVRIIGINALELARPGELTFAESDKLLPQVRASRAAAVIVSASFPPVPDRTLLRVEHPRLAFVEVMYLFRPASLPQGGVDRHAVIAPDAQLAEGVVIRECAVIRPHAQIGPKTVIESGAHIGERVSIGERCFIGPNVVIMRDCRIGNRVIIHGGTVIGADGFGFVWAKDHYVKIPQLGDVVIEDDVELGANVCVDRATLGSTIIKRGTKIDNLVQIAHNDILGEHVIISGQVGLAGSVRLGDRVMAGGQAGVVDHISIGDDVRIGAAGVVTKNVPAGQTVWGYPARPIEEVKRELAALSFLPKLMKEFKRPTRTARRRTKR